MDPCIIAYMFLTYAIKAAVFVWIFQWLKDKLTDNFIVIILVITALFGALDYLLVSILPASGWKKNLRDRIRVPQNMQCILALDYLFKALLFYYLVVPDSAGVSFYLSSTMLVQFIIVFILMLGIDIIVAWSLEKTVNTTYAEQFCSMCSM